MRCALLLALLCATSVRAGDDPYLWLEDSEDPRTLAWVSEQNERAAQALTTGTEFASLLSRLTDILQSDERIPYVIAQGDRYYNFWRDGRAVRGLWRRTDLESYRSGKPNWETVLDLDALAVREHEDWVWRGANCLYPEYRRCLVRLSRGGSDAIVIREFDTRDKQFPVDGFTLREAKSRVAWRDANHLYIGTDFGPDSLTNAGYPRIIKMWARGARLADAITVFEGRSDDVSVAAFATDEPGYRRELITRIVAGESGQTFIRQDNRWLEIELPDGVEAGTFRNRLLVRLRNDWRVQGRSYPAGALLSIDLERFLAGNRAFTIVFQPSWRSTLIGYSATRNRLLLNVLENLQNKIYSATDRGWYWQRQSISIATGASLSVSAVNEFESDDYFLTRSGPLSPNALYLGHGADRPRETLRRLPAQFDTTGLRTSTFHAVSKDGTRVPYLVVGRANLLSGPHPTLLTGYGGFELTRTPQYDPVMGAAWLERGGVYVVATIRGGGEFGPAWHQAALRERRQNAFDDFIAVAQDLIARGITSPPHLGTMGTSNGGLLVAAVAIQRPDLFNAVVSQAPLLDMQRFSKLSAGASWIKEFGDPDKAEDWGFLSKYSPYQNVTSAKRYPPMLFMTSLRDDRVHPAHARKMTARMLEQSHDVWFYESPEGGHVSANVPVQQAYSNALAYSFLMSRLR